MCVYVCQRGKGKCVNVRESERGRCRRISEFLALHRQTHVQHTCINIRTQIEGRYVQTRGIRKINNIYEN